MILSPKIPKRYFPSEKPSFLSQLLVSLKNCQISSKGPPPPSLLSNKRDKLLPESPIRKIPIIFQKSSHKNYHSNSPKQQENKTLNDISPRIQEKIKFTRERTQKIKILLLKKFQEFEGNISENRNEIDFLKSSKCPVLCFEIIKLLSRSSRKQLFFFNKSIFMLKFCAKSCKIK